MHKLKSFFVKYEILITAGVLKIHIPVSSRRKKNIGLSFGGKNM
jgi:hypothetical protein